MTATTPMMRQYQEIKQTVPDAILFFRMGDFYEMFMEDAKTASSILNIALTARDGGKGVKVPMCGVPYHAAENYLNKLLHAGKKVAICEQIGDPKLAKGLVKREVTRIVTPGTVLSESVLADKKNNFIVCVSKIKDLFGLSFMDLSTGEYRVTEFSFLADVISELSRIIPSECLVPEKMAEDAGWVQLLREEFPYMMVSTIEDWRFDYEGTYPLLTKQFKTKSLDGFGCEQLTAGISAAGALLYYLKDELGHSVEHVRKLFYYTNERFMLLDQITQRNLELTSSMRSGETRGTLIHVLDNTVTPMGARLLTSWLIHPLMDPDEIMSRQDGVEVCMRNAASMQSLREVLRNIRDIERLLSRIHSGYANARDMVSLKTSLRVIPEILEDIKTFDAPIMQEVKKSLDTMDDVVEHIETAIADEPPLTVREGGIIKEGYNKELDELRSIAGAGKDWIRNLQKQEMEKTGIKSLKVGYNKVFGYYIEVSKSYAEQVPEEYIRKQTLVNGERFITTELKEYESKILGAQEKINSLEYSLFQEIREEVKKHTERIQRAASGIALLDVLANLGWIAQKHGYIKPVVNESEELVITGGRHPVIERMLEAGKFVPNDTLLNTEEHQLLIITGPNMAGKSTYIRQVALLVIMAQIGSFIPAEDAVIGIVDRVFTRVGASDELTRGQSTFMVEMTETANILNNATSNSLIILDEIGRGTSTFDGISIAWSVAEYIHNNSDVRARTLFATHFFELTDLELTLPGVKNYNIAVKEWNDEIVFLRKIVKGSTDKSYGIHVARLAGLPREVIERAKDILNSLEESYVAEDDVPKPVASGTFPEDMQKPAQQLSLFDSQADKIYKKLKGVDINKMTPLEALNKLQEIKGLLE